MKADGDAHWRRQLSESGFVQVPGLLTPPQVLRLRDEAHAARSGARVRRRRGFKMTDDGRLLGPTNRLGGVGEAVAAIGRDEGLVSRVRSITGLVLRPERCTYLYYRRGDFLALHRDRPRSTITVLVHLRGRGGPLRVHPELVGVDDRSLLEIAERSDGHPRDGRDVRLEQAPCVLAGHATPHSRPPHPYEEDLVLAAFIYADDSAAGVDSATRTISAAESESGGRLDSIA